MVTVPKLCAKAPKGAIDNSQGLPGISSMFMVNTATSVGHDENYFQGNMCILFSNVVLVVRTCVVVAVQSLSCVPLFATPWTAARQAALSITNSWSPTRPMSIESVMPSNHLMLCCPLLLLPSIFSSIRVFSNESGLPLRRPKYWSFSFSISPSGNIQD